MATRGRVDVKDELVPNLLIAAENGSPEDGLHWVDARGVDACLGVPRGASRPLRQCEVGSDPAVR